MSLHSDATEIQPELVSLRRALHMAPEVGLTLPHTQQRVLDQLQDLDMEIATGSALSSVTAVLRGGARPTSGPVPAVLLRGDMDALPMTERTGLDYASQAPDAMHACGHDLHTSMLVGAARLLAEHRRELAGDVVLMFQPGEEGWDGAGHMIQEGVLSAAGDAPVAAYGMHVMSSTYPRGGFASRTGPLMAASDGLRVTVRGRGGHGSMPHRAQDPVAVACEIVVALQSMVTRQFDVFDPVVITVGQVWAGTRRNIIPDEAHFDATVRSFSQAAHRQLRPACERLCRGIAEAHGLTADVDYAEEYPVTATDAGETEFAGTVAAELFGQRRFTELSDPITGSEDFSRILERVPGSFLFLGACPQGRDPDQAPSNHSPLAEFDDAVLADGAALYAELAKRRLGTAGSAEQKA